MSIPFWWYFKVKTTGDLTTLLSPHFQTGFRNVEITNADNYRRSDKYIDEVDLGYPVFATVGTLRLEFVEFKNISSLSQLRTLILKGTVVTAEVFMLTQLTHLNIYHCSDLEYMPPDIGNMTKLQSLTVRDCGMRKVSNNISRLVNLNRLDFAYNPLEDVPPGILGLTALTDLNLKSNNIWDIPPEIGRLTNLQQLNIALNLNETLPLELCLLTQLKTLEFAGHRIDPYTLAEDLEELQMNFERLLRARDAFSGRTQTMFDSMVWHTDRSTIEGRLPTRYIPSAVSSYRLMF